jgi:endoglucanase
MTVKVDGQRVMSEWVWQTEWTNYATNIDLAGGEHTLEVAFEHDLSNDACDRNLRVDKISLVGDSEPDGSQADSSADGKLYVDPDSKAGAQADKWRSSRPDDAAQMDKVAAQPQARWIGGSNQNVQARTESYVSEAAKAGDIPVLVAYNIPNRDCGQYSSGGAGSAEAYRAWIRSFADGIGSRKAIVVLEPDALAFTRCLSEAQKQERFDLIRDAVTVLKERSNAAIYLDAGTNEDWISIEEMASRLRAAGVSEAQGFSLNVANHYSTQREIAYGNKVSSRIGGKHFVIDTSRNGNGRNGESCNAPGRALGKRPTLNTGQPKVDAHLWIKVPGESDGACYGSSRAGEWLPEYVLRLAQRAAF